MGLASFLSTLFTDGRVRVAAGAPSSAKDEEESDAQLLAFERERRDDLPATPPEFSLEAARYGAVMLYKACQFLAYRDVEAETIRQELGRRVPCPMSSSTHYSVDMTLQYLPDVVRLAREKSADDPLVSALIQLAGSWPLSAVGITGAEEGDVAAIVADTCLLRVYVDRIIARHDVGRLGSQPVRDAAFQAIGAFPDLAPEAAGALGVPERMVDG